MQQLAGRRARAIARCINVIQLMRQKFTNIKNVLYNARNKDFDSIQTHVVLETLNHRHHKEHAFDMITPKKLVAGACYCLRVFVRCSLLRLSLACVTRDLLIVEAKANKNRASVYDFLYTV